MLADIKISNVRRQGLEKEYNDNMVNTIGRTYTLKDAKEMAEYYINTYIMKYGDSKNIIEFTCEFNGRIFKIKPNKGERK